MRHVEYTFEGLTVTIKSDYDESSKMYLHDIPDFESEPLYTPGGKPIVAAVQDRCCNLKEDEGNIDCGSCRYYSPNKKGDLIGICENPLNNKDNTGKKVCDK